RAMLDGQIHDIDAVTKTIKKVKEVLEKKLGQSLHKVCIAAAGRVLKTLRTEASIEIEDHIEISKDMVLSLELQGMEKAMHQINYQKHEENQPFYCVGYSVVQYFLNDFVMTSLLGHRGNKIGVEVLSTFLPAEVVNSLYKVVELAGLSVYSLTLEPIAAIQVAIPKQYRLLNIALVDIGAGTSDIAITKGGAIVAYGMIPVAGDEITETIVHQYLVDFATAEKIKIKASSKTKSFSFKDAMGLKQTVLLEDVRQVMRSANEQLAHQIAEKIKELNGGNSTNAVFLVGGGGQSTDFTSILADHLGINPTRVALRGKDVLSDIMIEDTELKKNPEFVTPIGICLTGLVNNQHDFIEVFLNDEAIRIFNTNRLSVMDVVALKGIDPQTFISRKGQDLNYELNGEAKKVRGELGEMGQIFINNKEGDLSSPIHMHDYIHIVPAKNGKSPQIRIKDILGNNFVWINNEKKILEYKIRVNHRPQNFQYQILEGDQIEFEFPSLQEVLESFEQHQTDSLQSVFINEKEATLDQAIHPEDQIHLFMKETENKESDKSKNDEVIETKVTSKEIQVVVNGKIVQLSGKNDYVFADIFDFYPFDRSRVKGNLVTTVNGQKNSYLDPIQNTDVIEIYWKS
ncbi:MAG: rod shape-determining protein, partial [Vallitaleaceae bacterium]|nr:rod shape-determining protein [Vallitaleaceae bacterium]